MTPATRQRRDDSLAGDRLALVVLVCAIGAPFVSRWEGVAAVSTALALLGAVILAVGRRRRLANETVLCICFAVFMLSLSILVGSLHWRDPRFWAGEGRSLLAVAIVGFVGVMPLGRRSVSTAISVVSWTGVLTGVLAALFVIARPSWLTQPNTEFTGLTSSHHVQGAICSFLGGLLFVRWLAGLRERQPFLAFAGAGGFSLGLLTSFSRVSLLATAVGLVFVLAVRGRRVAGSVRAVAHPFALRTALRVSAGLSVGLVVLFFTPLAARLSIPNPLQPDAQVASESRAYNAENRFVLWSEFLPEVASSPLIGVGPWRINDDSTSFLRPLPFVTLGTGPDAEVDGFSTHNVVLQLAADAGLLGLAWFAALVFSLFRRGFRSGSAQALAASYLVWAALMQGLTGNSLLTTATALPFSVAFCLGTATAGAHRAMTPSSGPMSVRDVPPAEARRSALGDAGEVSSLVDVS